MDRFMNFNKPTAQALQIVLLGFALLIAFGTWAIVAGSGGAGGIGIAVCLAGAIGGLANNFFRRLRELHDHPPITVDNEHKLWLMTLQIYVSPMVGAMFALVLYIAFMSGILEAPIFPKFILPNYDGLGKFGEKAVPVTGADAAKALFWSFVAGFLEGFVPGIIDKFAKKADESIVKAAENDVKKAHERAEETAKIAKKAADDLKTAQAAADNDKEALGKLLEEAKEAKATADEANTKAIFAKKIADEALAKGFGDR